MSLWITATLLVAAALGFALAPFLRPMRKGVHWDERDAAVQRDDALLALYRQRLEEVEQECAVGVLDASSRAEVEQEMARGLLDEFDAPQPANAGPGRSANGGGRSGGNSLDPRHADDAAVLSAVVGAESRAGVGSDTGDPVRVTGAHPAGRGWAWVLVALGIPLLTFVVYPRVGEPQAQLLREAPRVLELDPQADRLEVDRWRVLLASRLQSRPDDARSRYLLGHIYLRDGDYARAAEAFALARASLGDDPTLDWAWLQAVYLANGGWLDETGKIIAERLLRRVPNNPMVLEILAIDAYRRGDYREAVGRFNQALGGAVAPAQRKALQHFVGQARAMLGELQPRIDVRLTVSTPPPESATLFVIARPVGGGMPYAVVRRPVASLPNHITLDDAVTMNPDRPLSAAEQVEVVTRISLTGAARRQAGDWEWVSEPLSIKDAAALSLAAQLRPPN